jgi:hypothetical protein
LRAHPGEAGERSEGRPASGEAARGGVGQSPTKLFVFKLCMLYFIRGDFLWLFQFGF